MWIVRFLFELQKICLINNNNWFYTVIMFARLIFLANGFAGEFVGIRANENENLKIIIYKMILMITSSNLAQGFK